MTTIASLREEYSRFYAIRNTPAEKTEFENWNKLSDNNIEAWCVRLQGQAKVVAGLIEELQEMKSDRSYHEMKSYFYEDLTDLRKDLEKRGFRLDIQ